MLGIIPAAAARAVALVQLGVLSVGGWTAVRRVLRLTSQAEAAVAAVAEGFCALGLAEGVIHTLRCDARAGIIVRLAAQARKLRRERRECLAAMLRARGSRGRKNRRLYLRTHGLQRRRPARDAREGKRLQLVKQRLERAAGRGGVQLRIAHEAQQRQIAGKAAAEDVIRARLLQNVQNTLTEQCAEFRREGIVLVKIRT